MLLHLFGTVLGVLLLVVLAAYMKLKQSSPSSEVGPPIIQAMKDLAQTTDRKFAAFKQELSHELEQQRYAAVAAIEANTASVSASLVVLLCTSIHRVLHAKKQISP